VINGIHSNIPVCCSFYFSSKVFQGKSSIAFNTEQQRGNDVQLVTLDTGVVAMKMTNNNYVEYVQCDKCFKNHKSNVIKKNGIIAEWLI
jgi:uncharacterized CHY-type Zn-finger protein